ncbi:MAG: alcohol dehydrogenase catalytic domain-containing protein [Anaerolineae bacterium]|nr:alcohol dehydrogenase catalytic domain-containing protein [Anaerolineae bacterium]
MRAALLVGPRQIELRRVPDPSPPKGGLVLRVEACGICGSDIRRWKEGPAEGAQPIVPGHEVGGVVIATDADQTVTGSIGPIAVGDRLALAPDVHCGRCYYCQRGLYNLCDDLHLVGITPGYPGGMAEQMPVSAEVLANGIVHPIPAGLSFGSAALAEPLASVLAAHEKVGTSLGHMVMIIGAGPIGCLHIAVAKARGALVIVSQRSPLRREFAQRFGPDRVVDPDELAVRVREFTQGRGADIAICANPVADTQRQAVELVRKGGRVVLFGGLPKADPWTHLDGNRIHYGEIQVLGAFSYHPTHHALALSLLARHMVRSEDLVTHRYPLSEIGAAFETAASGQGLKIMLEPQQAG